MAEELNPYSPPRADTEFEPEGRRLNVAGALAGKYDYRIGEIMSEAWQKLPGYKAAFWGTAIVGGLVLLVFQVGVAFIAGMLGKSLGAGLGQVLAFLAGMVLQVLSFPLIYLPVTSVALTHLDGREVHMRTVFDHSGRLAPYFIGGALYLLFVSLGLLLIIPGIYLSIAYMMVVPLIHEGRLPPGEALRISRIAVGRRWFKFFGLWLAVSLVNTLAALPLGIGLIWTMPWMSLCLVLAYRRMFGAPAQPTAG